MLYDRFFTPHVLYDVFFTHHMLYDTFFTPHVLYDTFFTHHVLYDMFFTHHMLYDTFFTHHVLYDTFFTHHVLYDTGQQSLCGLLNTFGGWLSLLVLFILWGITGAVLKHNISPISHKNHPKEALYNDNIISDKYHSSLSQESVIKHTMPHDHKLRKFSSLKLDFKYLKFYWTHRFNNLQIFKISVH